nr:UvrD-helicase domain-containing protein [Saprospiraceae bacterium]
TLHSDIETYITRIFEIVTTAISEYEQYKKLRGIIDYTDMEVSINKLLDDPAVQAVLSQEIDLLLVDEFQDTSPIQLEIFLKLSRLANQSIWVGDPKQSIYGFRGAEPKLMHSIVQALGGIKPEDILTHSYRSRADLVFAANAIFCKAFDELPNELIALQPANEKISDPYDSSEALIHWHYEFADKGKITKEWMDNCIAQSIYQLLQKPFVFKPKNSNTSRTLLPGDIAILCRTNTNCADMAAALNRFGIKASLSRNGLVKTIECRLILACLKYILDKNDSLSVAEILYLAEHQTMQHILDDRLQFLATDVPESRWATDSPLIKKLNELRPKMVELSGSEILNLIIERLNLSNIIVSYGSATQRLGNVDQLKKIANQYEENCNRLQSAASLGGFLLWLETLHTTEKDLQAINTTADAVHIATYHKSKGLEYPLVVCHQLDGQLKDDVWGVAVVDDREQIDLDAILAHRWVRLWINPFANLIKNTLLEEKISQSPQQATATAKAKAEEARLLYVGITRARDYLVFPTYKTPTRWLNRVYQNSDEIPSLDEHTTDTVWSWNGVFLDKQTAILEQPKDFELPESAATETVMYWG